MKNWWKRFRQFSQLRLSSQLLLIQAFALVGLIRVSLKLLPFQQFGKLYSKLTRTKKRTDASNKLIDQRTWAIHKVSGVLSAICLPQALALACFLGKDKHIELIVSVRKSHTFEAHAWVERNGIILIGDLPGIDFQPLWTWQ